MLNRHIKKHIKAYKNIEKPAKKPKSFTKNPENKMKTGSEDLSQTFKEQLVQRIVKNFLDIQILKLIQAEPTWGYMIIKRVKALYDIKIGHGAIYPLLNSLEAKGFLRSKNQTRRGRARKVYEITSKGIQFIESYYDFLREQLKIVNTKRRGTER